MRNVCFQIVRLWGTKSRLNIAEHLWILSMLRRMLGYPLQRGPAILIGGRIRVLRSKTVLHRNHHASGPIRQCARGCVITIQITGNKPTAVVINQDPQLTIGAGNLSVLDARHGL
jgi:hypothetical protein